MNKERLKKSFFTWLIWTVVSGIIGAAGYFLSPLLKSRLTDGSTKSYYLTSLPQMAVYGCVIVVIMVTGWLLFVLLREIFSLLRKIFSAAVKAEQRRWDKFIFKDGNVTIHHLRFGLLIKYLRDGLLCGLIAAGVCGIYLKVAEGPGIEMAAVVGLLVMYSVAAIKVGRSPAAPKLLRVLTGIQKKMGDNYFYIGDEYTGEMYIGQDAIGMVNGLIATAFAAPLVIGLMLSIFTLLYSIVEVILSKLCSFVKTGSAKTLADNGFIQCLIFLISLAAMFAGVAFFTAGLGVLLTKAFVGMLDLPAGMY